jgi:large repetitive protein
MRIRHSCTTIVAAIAAITCTLAVSAGARTLANGEGTATGATPKQAMVGQLVTISGMNLDGTTSVSFGKVASHSVRVDPNGTWVRAVVPAGVPAGSVYITLDQSGNPVSFGPFQILPGSVPAAANPAPGATATGGVSVKPVLAPRISGFSPTAGAVGSRVTIAGANLGGALWLKFGGVRGHISLSTATKIIALVPKNAHSGKITVHTSRGGTSVSTQRFLVVKSAGA